MESIKTTTGHFSKAQWVRLIGIWFFGLALLAFSEASADTQATDSPVLHPVRIEAVHR